MKKYLVSGLGISDGGVGRLMRNLMLQGEEAGFITVSRRNPQPIGQMLKKRQYLRVAFEIFFRVFDSIRFAWRVKGISHAVIVFVHPQTAGFTRFLNVVRRNQVYLYVMDNSFFCIKSYNLHPELEAECLRCLPSSQYVLPACQPFPVRMDKGENLECLDQLKDLSHQITFLAQNANQAELVRARFGPDTRVRIVGLDTGELKRIDREHNSDSKQIVPRYDLVFHGAPQLAKGIRYFVELAESLADYTALIPSTRAECEQIIKRPITANNITFRACTWETGLKTAIQTCELVINPSLWSAPIEGALQKSIFYAKRVAVVETEFGYEKEFPCSDTFIRLSRNVQAAAAVVQELLVSSAVISTDGKSPDIIFPQSSTNIFQLIMQDEA